MDLLHRTSTLIVILLLFGCGSSPPPDGPSSCASACDPNQRCDSEGDCVCAPGFLDCDGIPENGCEAEGSECAEPEPTCEPESDRALCQRMQAACGELSAMDNCLATRTVVCGDCPSGLECDATFQCSEPPLQAYELCSLDGESLGSCDADLSCLGIPSTTRRVCALMCTSDQDCADGQSCGLKNETGTGICGEPQPAGAPCMEWWQGPGYCWDPDEEFLFCLGGSCRIPCNYRDGNGEVFQCPHGQICDYAPKEYPELPGVIFSTCIDKPVIDPCRELPPGGRCSSYRSYESCVVNGGSSSVVETACDVSERCENGPGGASCQPLGASCVPNHSYCSSTSTMTVCGRDGSWQELPCDTECRGSPTGASCAPEGTTTIQGTLLFERIDPNDSMTDWSTTPTERPATGLLAVSYRDDDVIDTSSVAEDGSFAVRVPEDGDPDRDRIVFFAQGTVLEKPGYAFSVASPGLPEGSYSTQSTRNWDPSTWVWSVGLPTTSGQTFVIRRSDGSAAVQLFAALRTALRRNAAEYGPTTPSVVVWYAPGVEWDCGACFKRTSYFGMSSQIFIDGGPDLMAVSDSVIVHELGHFTMWAHGTIPDEAGQHCLFNPSLPGMAWSEGFATWYSSEVRRDGIYANKQQGTFFFFDFDGDFPRPFGPVRPTPSSGLLQRLDEVWISASLRRIAQGGETSAPLWSALISPRMNQKPFARGYLRHSFSAFDAKCDPINPVQTRDSTPIFADFLDALVCDGLSTGLIDDAISPDYPYPSDAPLCGGSP